MTSANIETIETATLGGGCFWCLEAVFQELPGVVKVVSGYSGGQVANPSYQQVCNGATGHAEVVQVKFDLLQLTFTELLQVFFKFHNPTTLNRQGADRGTQYRSVIFYHSPEQESAAQRLIAALEAAKVWEQPIVTELVPFQVFYPAEDYHQEYFRRNSRQPYCQAVIAPKLANLKSQVTRDEQAAAVLPTVAPVKKHN